MISIEREDMIRSRKLFCNEYRLREWIGEFLETTREYRDEIARMKAEIAKLEADVVGWRAEAECEHAARDQDKPQKRGQITTYWCCAADFPNHEPTCKNFAKFGEEEHD